MADKLQQAEVDARIRYEDAWPKPKWPYYVRKRPYTEDPAMAGTPAYEAQTAQGPQK